MLAGTMMKHLFIAACAVLTWGGCTSSIKLTDEQIKLRSSLDEPTASRELVGYLKPLGAGGLCRTASPYTNVAMAHLGFEGGILSFDAKRSVAAAGVSGGFVSTSISTVPERESVDLRKLTRIQRIDPKDRGQSNCWPLNWSVVIAHPSEGPAFWVVVKPEQAGEVVALLSFFSPHAEITAGIGF
jgi:hypothetical protein